MDQATIQQIAAEVARHLPSYACSLQDQLRANTELVETIKSEVSQKDWAQRERTNLRRMKLEALLTALHDCDAHLDRVRHKSAEAAVPIPERDPANDLDTIAVLYAPELQNEVISYIAAYRQEILLAHVLVQELLKAGQDLDARQKAFDKYTSEFKPMVALQVAAQVKIAARRLLVNIMGVED